ncbi:hypothetical protein MBR110_30175 (plasmid) [Burkholderia sp. MBR-1]|nr:hypothetical protein MBR110_30175 [Burkholderia sp. MBR-1]
MARLLARTVGASATPVVLVLFLNRSFGLIDAFEFSRCDASVVTQQSDFDARMRDCVKIAMQCFASAVIFAAVGPSPSVERGEGLRRVVRRWDDVSEVLDVPALDMFVVERSSVRSLKAD